jgi:hypothetical protein
LLKTIKAWLAKVAAYVAATGQGIQFVAFFAHAGVASFVVEHLSFGHYGIAALLFLAGGGVKEFYFDARYEQDPPQTFMDNLEDWSGWAVGAVLGYFLHG